MYSNLDFSGLVWLAIVGAVALVVGGLGFVGALVWFVVHHVAIV